jgi:hypothetical protein
VILGLSGGAVDWLRRLIHKGLASSLPVFALIMDSCVCITGASQKKTFSDNLQYVKVIYVDAGDDFFERAERGCHP